MNRLSPQHQQLIIDNPNLSDLAIEKFIGRSRSCIYQFRLRNQCGSKFTHGGVKGA